MAVEALQNVFSSLYGSLITWIPSLIFAAIIILIGYVIGRVVGVVVERVLFKAGVDKFVKGAALRIKLSPIFGTITRWIIYFIFIVQAAQILAVPTLILIIDKIVEFIPGIVGAVIVVLTSYAIGIYVEQKVIGSKEIYGDILGKVLFFLIVYVGIAFALSIVKGVPTELINQILLVIIASVGAGLAIALGLGLKDFVHDLSMNYEERFGVKRKKR